MRFTRTSHSTLLTEDGMHLRQRAEEILALGLIDFALMIEPFPVSFTVSYAICHQGEKLCFWSSSTRAPISGVRS